MANRDYRSLPSYRPTVAEWQQLLGQQGDDGGLSAELVEHPVAINEGINEAEEIKQMAEGWVKGPWKDEVILKKHMVLGEGLL